MARLVNIGRVMGTACLVGVLVVWVGRIGVVSAGTDVAGHGVLDGKAFIGEIVEQGKTKGDADELRFDAGSFRSTACDAYGFSAAGYTSAQDGQVVRFQAQTTSPTDGTMMWDGVITGDAIEATAQWYKQKGDAPKVYSFKGLLKVQPTT